MCQCPCNNVDDAPTAKEGDTSMVDITAMVSVPLFFLAVYCAFEWFAATGEVIYENVPWFAWLGVKLMDITINPFLSRAPAGGWFEILVKAYFSMVVNLCLAGTLINLVPVWRKPNHEQT